MQEMIITTVLMTVLGFGLRMWFVYAGMRAVSGSRRAARDDDYGLSFDEKVAKRLSEMSAEQSRRD